MKHLFLLLIFLLFCTSGFTQSKKELREERRKEKKELRQKRREERQKMWSMANGKYHLFLINNSSGDSLIYKDDNIEIRFTLYSNINFQLNNIDNAPIIIDWNKVSIVMPDGTSHKIIHNGVKYIDRGEKMSKTTIPPNAKIKDEIVPIENIEMIGSHWRSKALFRHNPKSKKRLNNKTFSIFMPIELSSGNINNYNFKFKIRVY